MPELLYKKAGHIELYRYRDGKRYLYNGVVNSIASSITKNTATVPDGNRNFDHTFSAGMVGSVTVNLNSFVPSLYGAIASGDTSDKDAGTIHVVEEITVPDVTPFTVTLKRTPVADTVVILDAENKEFTKAASAPVATGEYTVADSTITFASVDAGLSLIVGYDVTSQTQETTISEDANNDTWRVTVVGEATMFSDEGVTKADNLIIDKAMVSGELAMPTRQKEPAGWSFTLNVLPPRPGRKPVTYIVEK